MRATRTKVMRLASAALSIALCTLALTGCAELDQMTAADIQSPDSIHFTQGQFDDVPAPYGFRVMERRNESLRYEADGMRIGRTTYRGPLKPRRQLADFYRDHMSRDHGWELVNATREGAAEVLRFAKNTSACSVNVYEKNNYSYIEIKVNTVHES